jgi:hypothetical protein
MFERLKELGLRCLLPAAAGHIALTAWPGLRDDPSGAPWIDPEDTSDLLTGLKHLQTTRIFGFCEENDLPSGAIDLWRGATRTAGLVAVHMPIHDYAPPDAAFMRRWTGLRPELLARLVRGETVALSCLFGAGRSGTVAALLLTETGLDMRTAIASVKVGFGPAIESPMQDRWLRQR